MSESPSEQARRAALRATRDSLDAASATVDPLQSADNRRGRDSFLEGLSLSLLEATRSQLNIRPDVGSQPGERYRFSDFMNSPVAGILTEQLIDILPLPEAISEDDRAEFLERLRVGRRYEIDDNGSIVELEDLSPDSSELFDIPGSRRNRGPQTFLDHFRELEPGLEFRIELGSRGEGTTVVPSVSVDVPGVGRVPVDFPPMEFGGEGNGGSNRRRNRRRDQDRDHEVVDDTDGDGDSQDLGAAFLHARSRVGSAVEGASVAKDFWQATLDYMRGLRRFSDYWGDEADDSVADDISSDGASTTDVSSEEDEQEGAQDEARSGEDSPTEEDVDDSEDDSDDDSDGKKKGRRSKGSMAKPFGAGESGVSHGGRSVFEGVVGGFGPWVNPGRQGRGRSTGGGRVLETRGDLAPWVYGDPRGGGRSGGRGALRDVGLDPWTNPKRDDDYGDGGRGAFPVDPGTDPVAGFRNVARASGSSQSSLALAMGIHPAALEDFE